MIRVRVRVNFKIQENTKLQKSENSNSPYKNVIGMVRKFCTCHVLCIQYSTKRRVWPQR